MTRVMVVGVGIAGAAAALAAAAEGAEVVLVGRGPGATALYAGAMEIAPDLGPSIAAPQHPLGRLELDEPALRALAGAALDGLRAALAPQVALVGGLDSRGVYVDVAGRRRTGQVVPEEAAGGEAGALRGRPLAVIDVEGLTGVDAGAVVDSFREFGVDARREPARVLGLGFGAGLADLAGFRAPETGAGAAAYPPGFALPLPPGGFELMAAAPSPHGWRLQRALEAALPAAGVAVVRGSVGGFEGEANRLLEAEVGDRRLAADTFVLATGRFLGGGLVKDALPREPLLGLPVFCDGEPVLEMRQRYRRLERVSPDPAFRAGLLTDRDLRPVDPAGRPVFTNLLAAGSVLGGYDFGEGFGFGVPLLTGWLAGRLASR